mgnify:CR=1 FL=1|jgi:hypothetical protein
MFKCDYCKKTFRRETTIATHTCEVKRRYLQEKDHNVQLGFRAYQLFYRIGTNSKKEKSYEHFVKSNYYSAFVRFGGYCIDLRIDDSENYVRWLLKNSIKLDKWTSDLNFNKWNKDRLKRESVDRAVERTVIFMMEWATPIDRNWSDYWQYANTNDIVFHICAGRISPWVIYSSKKAQSMLDKLNSEQLNMIIEYIDPTHWQRKLKTHASDFTWVESVLGE